MPNLGFRAARERVVAFALRSHFSPLPWQFYRFAPVVSTAAPVTHKAAYSQLLTLPGPVQSEKMKVKKKEGMLVVTLSKAT